MPTSLPSTADIKKPLLSYLKRRKDEVSLDDAMAHVVKTFNICSVCLAEKQGCGKETIFQNRLRWARWELKQEGLVETTRRGYFRFKQ